MLAYSQAYALYLCIIEFVSIEKKLKQLPSSAGVYFHKNKAGEIIYIGKAANLRNRVRQYFHKSRVFDPKTDALVAEIADIDWTEVDNELDALFLEAELVRRYLPPYNILLRDDKSLVFVRISYKDAHPTVTLTRNPLDDKAEYFGPYFSALTVKKALRYLRKIFPFSTHKTLPKRVCLEYHLGLCPGLEENKTSLGDYRKNLRRLSLILKGQSGSLIKELEKEMKQTSKDLQFERSAKLRNQILHLKGLKKQIIFGDREVQDISKDQGLSELQQILGLKKPIKRLEGFDISHMQGSDTVSSMVVFKAGVPDRTEYRKFKLKIPGNDDFAHMAETLARRLKEQNVKKWGSADLLLIDGGKGQLSAAINARDDAGHKTPAIGLAKRQETLIVHTSRSNVTINTKAVQGLGGYINSKGDYMELHLPLTSHAVKLLQRVRDESHRFAVSYHSLLKTKRQTASLLDEISGIGPLTRKKLIKNFGSLRAALEAKPSELENAIGKSKAQLLISYQKSQS